MILIYSLIVLLVLLILAYLYKNGIDIFNYGRKKEGFAEAGAGASTADIETSAAGTGTSAAGTSAAGTSAAGTSTESASQKAYNQATLQQTNEENNTVEKHKKILDSSLDMNKLQNQVNELLKLGGEAKNINESLKK